MAVKTRHLGIGKNVLSGTVNFEGRKVSKVTFPTPFNKKPAVTITLEDAGAAHTPYKTRVKNTDFRIGFKTPHTGLVAWKAEEIE